MNQRPLWPESGRLAMGCLLFVASCLGSAPIAKRAVALQDEGALAMKQGNHEVARAKFELALEYHPRFTEAWVNLSAVSLSRGDLERAWDCAVRAIELNENLPAPHHAAGMVLERRGSLDRAAGAYRGALAVDPGFLPARVNLGRLLFARGAFEEAEEQLFRASLLDPTNPDVHTLLANTYLRRGKLQEALESVRQAQRLLPNGPEVELVAAKVDLGMGMPARARARLESLTRATRGTGEAWAWLSLSRLADGDRAGAAQACEQASRLSAPRDLLAYVRARVSISP